MRHFSKAYALLAAGAVLMILATPGTRASQSPVAARTAEQMLDHHLAMFAARNLEGMIDDFAADAVWINADGVLNGKAAIRAHYAPAFSRPAAAPGQGPRIYLKLYSQNVAYMLWVRDEGKPSEQRGAESYWVRDGLIVAQTVGNFRTPPPATEPKNP